MQSVLAVIGGSGIHGVPGLEDQRLEYVDTPFGAPSDAVLCGTLAGVPLLFLPRHGRGHKIAPHQINSRANICALKKLGATQVVSLSAVGSMREDIKPGDVVVVDQYIDLTRGRIATFFDAGVVAHVSFADPVCSSLAGALADAAVRAGASVHRGGSYLCIDGPAFSTRAESLLYRSWSVSVIGMTALPEAKLAREAELPYATLALATDYDCWHETAEDVSVDGVLAVLRKNATLAARVVAQLAPALPDPTQSPAARALEHALITDPAALGPETIARLDWLLRPYLRQSDDHNA